uniref:RNA polymerase II-associated protein 1 n=1 Tax=Lygus hesperus TaxID=30085 RepID=A0A146L171_LYGHE
MSQNKKKSLFAQRMEVQRETANGSNAVTRSSVFTSEDLHDSFGTRSYIVSGDEANRIHQDNLSKLSRMSHHEIHEEREKLLSTLDPGLVEFLRNRRKQRTVEEAMDTQDRSSNAEQSGQPAAGTSETTNTEAEAEFDAREIPDVKEFAHKYPHMDVVEDDKLKWIGELATKKPETNNPFSARFNFEGELLPYIDEGDGVLRGLHNHGEEQERPGYTLQELMQLSRSAVLQQRVIALTTISNILANASKYEAAFLEPILPILLEADMYLLLRFSLDDPSQRVVMASAGAICNLVVNHGDEVCLDLLMGTPLGLQQPSLGVVIDMKQSEMDELKDAELLKLDVVRGMVRTNILERYRYILEKLNIEPVEIKQTLKTLTRMSRHSYEIANAIFSLPDLLDIVVKKLLVENNSGSFYPEALKLFRVLAARSRTLAENIIEKYGILDFLFKFIAGDKAQRHPEAMHLMLESFYTWQTFLSYKLSVDSMRAFEPILVKLLTVHFEYTNVTSSKSDMEHATALITTVSAVAKVEVNSVMFILPLACQCGMKWITQYSNTVNPNFSASKLVGAVLQLFSLTYNSFDCSNFEDNVEKLFRNQALTRSIMRLRKCSWLISGKIISNPENLPCLGSTPPTLFSESSLSIVYSLCTFLLATKNKKLMSWLIREEELFLYLQEVVESSTFRNLSGHWFARQELFLLVSIVHLYTSSDFGDHHRFMHRLAFTLLTIVHEGDKYLLADLISNVVFNIKYFRYSVDDVNERLDFLKLEEESCPQLAGKRDLLQQAIESLPCVETLYMKELGLDYLRPTWPPPTLTGHLNSTQAAFPSDWIFMPIMRLHQCEGNDKNASTTASLCLKWFILIEEFSSDLLSNIKPAAKYCRLCCVFLAGPDLFRDVTPLLGLSLSFVTCKYDELNFEEDIPGLSSFYDFYRDVLEQYAGVSYCDTIFGRYILVPLAQKHNVKFKKIVWSELATILRLLRTPMSEVNMEHYLEPTESDPDLLMTYLRAVASGEVREAWCPVLYRMAFHHVVSYISSNNNKISKVLRDRIEKLGNAELKNQFLRNFKT